MAYIITTYMLTNLTSSWKRFSTHNTIFANSDGNWSNLCMKKFFHTSRIMFIYLSIFWKKTYHTIHNVLPTHFYILHGKQINLYMKKVFHTLHNTSQNWMNVSLDGDLLNLYLKKLLHKICIILTTLMTCLQPRCKAI